MYHLGERHLCSGSSLFDRLMFSLQKMLGYASTCLCLLKIAVLHEMQEQWGWHCLRHMAESFTIVDKDG